MVKRLFVAALRAAGPFCALRCFEWPISEGCKDHIHALHVSTVELARQGFIPKTSQSCRVKSPFWISAVAVSTTLLSQLWPIVCRQPPLEPLVTVIPAQALAVGLECTWQRYLFGIAVLEREIAHRSWQRIGHSCQHARRCRASCPDCCGKSHSNSSPRSGSAMSISASRLTPVHLRKCCNVLESTGWGAWSTKGS